MAVILNGLHLPQLLAGVVRSVKRARLVRAAEWPFHLPEPPSCAKVWSLLSDSYISGNGEHGRIKCGDTVDHVTFGRGVILEHWGSDCEICEVKFESGTHSVNC